ncbi:YTH domain-containing protein ECT2 [Linum grandiflorum]
MRFCSFVMEMYNVSGNPSTENYMIQQAAIDPNFSTPGFEQVQAMYNGGAPEYVVDQGMYYPTATNYGYYCTGYETPGEWEDHHGIFGVDGPEVQYAGAQTENLPYVCYTPSYGYAQSSYNPYNPYIPGAMVGVDDPYLGAQQYYALPPYQDSMSSAGYVPYVVQQDMVPSNLVDQLPDAGIIYADEQGGRTSKQGPTSAPYFRNPSKSSANQTHSFSRTSEGPRPNVGSSKYSAVHENGSSGRFQTPASRVLQGRNPSGSAHSVDNAVKVKAPPLHDQLKSALPVNNGFTDFGPESHLRPYLDKHPSNIHAGRTFNDGNGCQEALGEQNRGPRTSRLENQLAVKSYTTRVGGSNAEGNIIIHTDRYNRDDFQIDFSFAKFFVIKSYSEDDVHKSIKYNVWSSTLHGNKKLQSAYEDAQKIAKEKATSCPVFLFFSVNASGQFCGVAEMIGPVDLKKDMDFWQQDKWSGSFPVKWHMIKDVQNTSFRHIILENNEHKPVTNSRDTQEVPLKQGLQMLKIFKNHIVDTSLLDDFMYYENRQRIMQQEKARYLSKSFGTPFVAAALDPTPKLNTRVVLSSSIKEDKAAVENASNSLKETKASGPAKITSKPESAKGVGNDVVASTALKIGSLSINPSKPQSVASNPKSAVPATLSKAADVVTVGSVPVKVNGVAEASPRVLTFGTVPVDTKTSQERKGVSVSVKPKRAG